MTHIEPFVLKVSQDLLDDLHHRLASTRWPEKETVEDWGQGVPLSYMKELSDYWQNAYDWRAREIELNRFSHFMTNISGLDIHFIHQPSPHAQARPLLITHGWPGSFVEFHKVIDPLINPQAYGGKLEDAFHVVIPSLPGFGFSGKPSEPGWGVEKIADAWACLMARLGYDSYFAQGGDWGSMITTQIGLRDVEHCQAIHINMPIAGPDPEMMKDLTEKEQEGMAAMQFYQNWDSGYSKQQSTRPQTLGYGLADSPIGQAAWILEKFYQWTDCNGLPNNILSFDELLDNIMIYWGTNSATSSARIYWESFGAGPQDPVQIPSGCSIFPKEIFRPSRRWVEKQYTNLQYYNELERGGHFAAFEQPDLFVGEMRKFFGLFG